jgi:hypothetical protein
LAAASCAIFVWNSARKLEIIEISEEIGRKAAKPEEVDCGGFHNSTMMVYIQIDGHKVLHRPSLQ